MDCYQAWKEQPLAASLLIAAIMVGIFLRLQQLNDQVLIDDEWHAVHQVISSAPANMFFDFGFADYSVPLGILYWYASRWVGLSEIIMRLPMFVCGVATLVLFPHFIWRRFSLQHAAVFASLLAISPLLVIYSRMARPYAATFLLGWIAHFAFQRFYARNYGGFLAGAAYVFTAALSTWLHLIVGPFVLAPLIWGGVAAWRRSTEDERVRFYRVMLLGAVTGVAIAALIAPPLLANPHAMTAKSGIDSPNIETLTGIWFAWLGTPSAVVVVLCLVLAMVGAPRVFSTLPEARTGLLGSALVLAMIFLTRPAYSHVPTASARYLLPCLALILLCIAVGSVRFGKQVAQCLNTLRCAVATLISVVATAALAATSPLKPLLVHPNSETLHAAYHFDFRWSHNLYAQGMKDIPLSGLWSTLSTRPAGTIRIAVAPFYFESFNWDAPRWEQLSRQTIIPGFLSGLCIRERAGETPDVREFRFRNAVHLSNAAELAAKRIDYVVWQKLYSRNVDGQNKTIGKQTSHCEPNVRALFGTPVYEDATLIAFQVHPHRSDVVPK